MKRIICLLVVLLMSLAFVGCAVQPAAATAAPASASASKAATATTAASAAATTAGKIRIAVVGPMTGDSAEFGIGYKHATSIMAEKWNANGGLLGKQIELVFYDDKLSAEEAANIAQQVVADKSIVAVIGDFNSTCSMAAAPIYQENKIPMIAPSASHKDFTGIGDYIWRVSPLSRDESQSNVNLALDYYKAKKIGILALKNDWAIDTAKLCTGFIKDRAAQTGASVVSSQEVAEGNDDFASFISNFKKAEVDTIICACTYPTAIPFIKQLKKVMPNVHVIGFGNILVTQTLEIGGADAEGVTASVTFADFFTTDAAKEFLAAYAKKDSKATPNGDTAQSYDTAGVLFSAIKAAGSTDGEKIKAALKTITYQGVIGEIKFDENRDCPREYGQAIVKNGKWVQLTY